MLSIRFSADSNVAQGYLRMYQDYFEFRTLPFENTPDPTFFFMNAQYKETLHLMVHAIIARKGLICVTGPVGCGETTLAVTLQENLPRGTEVISVPHPKITPTELIEYMGEALGIAQMPASHLQRIEALRNSLDKLNAAGKCCQIGRAHV